MRLKPILLCGAVLASIVGVTPHDMQFSNFFSRAEAQNLAVGFSLFYDGLRDDGDWVSYNGRYVFVPTDLDDNWRPYTRGHWSHTRQYGWVWVSDERFGWATYHYGRWGYAQDIGWYWVPGKRWAPAWVSWRRSDNDVAWAPLPPSAYEDDDYTNVNPNFNVTLGALPFYFWVAVSARDFQDRDLNSRIVRDSQENQRIYDRSRFAGPVVVQNNTIINNFINVNFIQQQTGKPVQNVNVATTTDPAAAKSPQSAQQTTVTVFQGALTANPAVKPTNVKPVEQVQQKMASKPKLPGSNTLQPGAASPTAPPALPKTGDTPPPATGEATPPQAKAGAALTQVKPAEPVNAPKSGAIIVPMKPGEAGTTKPNVNGAVPLAKPAETTPLMPKATPIAPLAKPVNGTALPKSIEAVPPVKPAEILKPAVPTAAKIPPAKPQLAPIKPDLVPTKPAQPVQAQPPKPVAVPIVKAAPVQPPPKLEQILKAPPSLGKPANNGSAPTPAQPKASPKKGKLPDKAKPCIPPTGQKDCAVP